MNVVAVSSAGLACFRQPYVRPDVGRTRGQVSGSPSRRAFQWLSPRGCAVWPQVKAVAFLGGSDGSQPRSLSRHPVRTASRTSADRIPRSLYPGYYLRQATVVLGKDDHRRARKCELPAHFFVHNVQLAGVTSGDQVG